MNDQEKQILEDVWQTINVLQQQVTFLDDTMHTIQNQIDGVKIMLMGLHPEFAHEVNIICRVPYKPKSDFIGDRTIALAMGRKAHK